MQNECLNKKKEEPRTSEEEWEELKNARMTVADC